MWQDVACTRWIGTFAFIVRRGCLKTPVMAVTPATMYRIGARNAQLDRVRCPDVAIASRSGDAEIWVRASTNGGSPGISCWASHQLASQASVRGHVWELASGATYDENCLRLWQPRPDKWYWSPARDMRGSEFIAALRAVNALFK